MKTFLTLRLAIVNTVGFSASTVMPLWLGEVAGHFGMPGWYAGLAVALQLGAAALCNLLTPTLFPNTAPLPLARLAMVVAGAAYLLALVDQPLVFLASALLSGGALGVALNVINRMMGSSDHVQHGYALFVLMEVCIATTLFLTGAALIEHFGLMSLFAEGAVAAGIALLLLYHLPVDTSMPREIRQVDPTANPTAGRIGLLAFALFFVGQASLNSFMPTIGQASGLSTAEANQVVGLGMPFGFVGGMLARIVGERVRPMVPVFFVIALLACIAVTLTLFPAAGFFRIGMIGLACATMFAVPYFFAQLGAFDHTGRFTAFGPAMMLAGLSVGPSVTVLLHDRVGMAAVGGFSGTMLVLGGLAFLLALRQVARPSNSTATEG